LFNKSASVLNTIKKLQGQTFKDFEIIVVDDGSTDDSSRVVEGLSTEEPRLTLIKKQNGGVCSARNIGIQAAKGEYIALLDADDIWDKSYLEEQMRMISDFPDCQMWGINYGETINGEIIRDVPTGLPEGFRGIVEDYFRISGRVSDLFCSSSVLIRKTAFDIVGLFDERIRYAEDSDMWFRIIARFPVAFYDKYLVFYRFDAENRARTKHRPLRYFLPFFVDKYSSYKDASVFYDWVNQWSAQHIAYYYFNCREEREDAVVASRKLDYNAIPNKYKMLFRLPYFIGATLYEAIKLKNRILGRRV
jgi:Predicted glycosyltransferases